MTVLAPAPLSPARLSPSRTVAIVATGAGLVLVGMLSTGQPAAAAQRPSGRTVPAPVVTPASTSQTVHVLELASVRRLFHEMQRRRADVAEGALVAAWTDVSLVLDAVTASGIDTELTFEDVAQSVDRGVPIAVRAAAGVGPRDAAADRLLALGYSARETADVIGQRITQRALDTARAMIAAGGDRQAAADYLDAQYRRVLALRTPPPPTRLSPASGFDGAIERYALLHNVEAALVRAIIAAESNFNPAARSRAGALGLMQLMPGTARELGVNPLVPEQNIEGGVRYFAQLLRLFGRVDLALVAYNAGPGFAERYARGQTGLYGETREYVTRVLGRLAASR